MSPEDYRQQITLRVKDPINNWIDDLKEKDHDLLLTKQWNVIFPKGFRSGYNSLPVVTNSKHGKHLVGEVGFVLPDSLELDMEGIELSLKNEPYSEIQRPASRHKSLNEPLDVLNNIIMNANAFLQGLSPTSIHPQNKPLNLQSPGTSPLNISRGAASQSVRINQNDDIDDIRKQLLRSKHLPDWFRTIESLEIREQLITRIAESLAHYQRQVGHSVDLQEFFDKYTEMLHKQDKLYHYCKYKSKPVELDSNDYCTENYCSKKPYHSQCPNATLRFGIRPNN